MLHYELLTNKIFLSVAIATIIAQVTKTFIKLITSKSLDITKLWDTGGMPSSHASLASSLALAVYLAEGVTTVSIATFFFSLIVIRDAFGLRREAGEQAKVINKIIRDLKLEKKLNVKKLKELVGHTFLQVTVGIILGITVTLSIFNVDLIKYYPFTEGFLVMVLGAIYYALPGLIANMMPIFVKNHFKFLERPIDMGLSFRGRRVFGDHKTLRGFIFGIFGGILVGAMQFIVKDIDFFASISIVEYTLPLALTIGASFGFAALIADSIESFFKRQIGIAPGKPFIPFDQTDFILGIIACSYFFQPLSLSMIIVLLITGPLLSALVTKIGYKLKIREEKW